VAEGERRLPIGREEKTQIEKNGQTRVGNKRCKRKSKRGEGEKKTNSSYQEATWREHKVKVNLEGKSEGITLRRGKSYLNTEILFERKGK